MPIKTRDLTHVVPVDLEALATKEEFAADDPDYALYADRPEPKDEFGELLNEFEDDEEAQENIKAAERFFAFSEGNQGMTRHPREVPVTELLRGVQTNMNAKDPEFGHIEEFYRNRVRSPLTAIRAYCVLNEGGPKKANECYSVTCPLWAFRNGKNAFFGKNK